MARRKNTPNTIEDFWQNVDVRGNDDCWAWTLSRNHKGYGQFSIAGKMLRTHRIAISTVCDVPKGMHVLHKCDNRICCNPAHLFVGTNTENVADKMKKGRHRGPKGTANVKAKITEPEALFIKHSDIGRQELARIFGVTPKTISRIKLGKSWRHVR